MCFLFNPNQLPDNIASTKQKGDWNMGYAIKTKDLIKKYKDKTAVDGLTLTVNEADEE